MFTQKLEVKTNIYLMIESINPHFWSIIFKNVLLFIKQSCDWFQSVTRFFSEFEL